MIDLFLNGCYAVLDAERLESIDITHINYECGSINQIVLEIKGFLKNTEFPLKYKATRIMNEADDSIEWMLWAKEFPNEHYTPRTISLAFTNLLEAVIKQGTKK